MGIAATIAAHGTVAAGWDGTVALCLMALQGVAWALLLWSALPRRLRWLGPGAGTVLLAGIAVGGLVSAQTGLFVATGLAHALVYGALLFVFGSSLRHGRVAVVTGVAQRVNPQFRPGMIPYTRAVTWAWCAFAAAQLVASAVLLLGGELRPWLLLVGTLHAPMAAGLAVGEFLIRRWRFPGEHTSFVEMVRRIRAAD